MIINRNDLDAVGKWVQQLIDENRIHNFYTSSEWLRLRKEVLEEYRNECIDCKAKGFYTKASHVHHQQYVRKHPRLALSKTYTFKGKEYINLVPLCWICHQERHGYHHKKKEELTKERW